MLCLLLLLLLLEVGMVAQIAWVTRGPISGTRFMAEDVEAANRPGAPERLRRRLGVPAQEWVSIDNISRPALEVLVSREDQQLATRRLAIDVESFRKRVTAWRRGERDPSGSTIPQQVAKNLFTDGARTPWRKLVEANYALLMNAVLSDRRILEIYANIIEFGPGVYGVCAASWYYFAKPPVRLTQQDMATLVGLMPSPKKYTIYPTSPTVVFARVYAQQRVTWLYDGVPRDELEKLLHVSPTDAEPSCSRRPESLRTRMSRTQTADGYPRYADDQSYVARLTRQCAREPKWPKGVDCNRLKRHFSRTPGAR